MTEIYKPARLTLDQMKELADRIEKLCEEYKAKYFFGMFSSEDEENLMRINVFGGNHCPLCVVDDLNIFIRRNNFEHWDKGPSEKKLMN